MRKWKFLFLPLFVMAFMMPSLVWAKKAPPRVLVYIKGGDDVETVQSTAEEVLSNMGFRIFDRDQLKNIKEVDAALSKNDKQKLRALKYRYGIEVIVVGKGEKKNRQVRRIYGRRYVYFKPYVAMKAIMVDTAEIIYSKALRGHETSRSAALDKLAKKLAQILGVKIKDHWAKASFQSDTFEIVISKVPFHLLKKIEKYIRHLPRTQSYARRNFSNNTVKSEVIFRGSRTDLENVLVKFPLAKLKIIRTTANRIDAEVSAGAPPKPKDTQGPAITILQPRAGAMLKGSTIIVKGLAEDKSGVKWVKVNGVKAGLSGKTFQIALPATEGSMAIKVVASDNLGNLSQKGRTVFVDNTAPKVVILRPRQGRMVNKKTINVVGTVSDPYLSNLQVTGVKVLQLQKQQKGGQTRFQAKVSLKEGLNSIQVQAWDMAGNYGKAQTSVVVDTIPPSIKITFPHSGMLTNKTQMMVRGKVSDTSLQTVIVQGEVAVVKKGWFYAKIKLTNGKMTIQAIAKDMAGNIAQDFVTITVDNEPPKVSFRVLIKGTVDKPGTRVWVNNKEVKVVNGQWRTYVDILRVKRIVIVAIDPAGNRSVTVKKLGQ